MAALITPAGGSTYFLDETSCGNVIRAREGTVSSAAACENDIVLDAAPEGPEGR